MQLKKLAVTVATLGALSWAARKARRYCFEQAGIRQPTAPAADG